MRKLYEDILIIILFVILISVVIIGLFYQFIPNQYESNYVHAMYDKYDRLMEENEPKIVLIGDSNLAFGVNTEMLQKEIGMPVINMGLHGGIGNDVQTRIAMSNVNEGDIYVICYTDYGQTYDISQKDLTLIMLSRNKGLWSALSAKQKLELTTAIPDYMVNSYSFFIRGRGNEEVESIDYAYSAFNEWGDIAIRLKENRGIDADNYESRVPQISEKTIKDLQNWRCYCEERGANLVVAGYPILETNSMDDETVFDGFGAEISQKTGCEMISSLGDYIMPVRLFYDTNYHLTLEGADYRTQLLANDINQYLDEIKR